MVSNCWSVPIIAFKPTNNIFRAYCFNFQTNIEWHRLVPVCGQEFPRRNWRQNKTLRCGDKSILYLQTIWFYIFLQLWEILRRRGQQPGWRSLLRLWPQPLEVSIGGWGPPGPGLGTRYLSPQHIGCLCHMSPPGGWPGALPRVRGAGASQHHVRSVRSDDM